MADSSLWEGKGGGGGSVGEHEKKFVNPGTLCTCHKVSLWHKAEPKQHWNANGKLHDILWSWLILNSYWAAIYNILHSCNKKKLIESKKKRKRKRLFSQNSPQFPWFQNYIILITNLNKSKIVKYVQGSLNYKHADFNKPCEVFIHP